MNAAIEEANAMPAGDKGYLLAFVLGEHKPSAKHHVITTKAFQHVKADFPPNALFFIGA
jgi:hypothetical protein